MHHWTLAIPQGVGLVNETYINCDIVWYISHKDITVFNTTERFRCVEAIPRYIPLNSAESAIHLASFTRNPLNNGALHPFWVLLATTSPTPLRGPVPR